ncbi:hypothetical protein DFA_07640 [Cavenderia fasciculata]|uniref:Uncharacterized protein n=1 Tax=Cavenderia fasciculata TaxID=261658 RepID=F4Q2I3_CACFS|nr:uncharacterized protein DFA_07640 [Cavenderia fasciculata]EGG16662.1 hypothetical protein DFA_07640 [Cavenderia fasciculata]|eukprot:XP_004355136.1 hypothetical protein DFA_07640 [Cavenderia fasciculata]
MPSLRANRTTIIGYNLEASSIITLVVAAVIMGQDTILCQQITIRDITCKTFGLEKADKEYLLKQELTTWRD